MANPTSQSEHIHVKRIGFTTGNPVSHYVKCLFCSGAHWNQSQPSTYPVNMGVHRENILTAGEHEDDGQGFDSDPFQMAESLEGLVKLHVAY